MSGVSTQLSCTNRQRPAAVVCSCGQLLSLICSIISAYFIEFTIIFSTHFHHLPPLLSPFFFHTSLQLSTLTGQLPSAFNISPRSLPPSFVIISSAQSLHNLSPSVSLSLSPLPSLRPSLPRTGTFLVTATITNYESRGAWPRWRR